VIDDDQEKGGLLGEGKERAGSSVGVRLRTGDKKAIEIRERRLEGELKA